MRKRITKLVLFAAAVVCLAVGPQNTLQAAAGDSSHGSNCDCTLVARREIEVTEEVTKCTLREHNSGTCHVRVYWYQDVNVVSCSKCGEEKKRDAIGAPYVGGEEHFDFCR